MGVLTISKGKFKELSRNFDSRIGYEPWFMNNTKLIKRSCVMSEVFDAATCFEHALHSRNQGCNST